MTQRVEKEGGITVAANQQRLGRGAGGGPRLDQGKQERVGMADHDDGAQQAWRLALPIEDRRDDAQVRRLLVDAGVQVGQRRRAGSPDLRQHGIQAGC